eukprot:GHRR01023102.1.p2 GENE.GHRR01023102.1~~GHRR01023102.1.p2  ORF type:complete len:111 (+),score=2.58 GHRR01023102.1:595-927(+)
MVEVLCQLAGRTKVSVEQLAPAAVRPGVPVSTSLCCSCIWDTAQWMGSLLFFMSGDIVIVWPAAGIVLPAWPFYMTADRCTYSCRFLLHVVDFLIFRACGCVGSLDHACP